MNGNDLRNLFVKSLSASLDKLSIAKNGEQLKDIFICPICLQKFNLKECLNARDIISLEDVPPKALGGRPLTITCKNCNNSCGHDLDTYLVNEIRNGHKLLLSESQKQKGTISVGTTELLGKFSIDLNSKSISVTINENNNNPANIDDAKFNLKKAFEDQRSIDIKLKFTEQKRYPQVLIPSILKNAYLLAFHELGYRYILRSNLDIIRRQILYPQQIILISNPVIFQDEVFMQSFGDGVYKVSIGNQLCIGVIISLKLKEINIEHRFFVVLPDYMDEESRIYSDVLSKEQGQKCSIIAKLNNRSYNKSDRIVQF